MTIMSVGYKVKLENFRVWAIRTLCVILASLCVALSAKAQTFESTTTGAINAATACGTADLDIPIVVTGVSSVVQMSVGFLAEHTWRGDIDLRLTSPGPSPVTVQLIIPDTSFASSMDDYNINMSDGFSTQLNIAPHDTDDTLPAPPYSGIVYQNNVLPDNALSAFNGLSADGTWTLSMCDALGDFDDGTFEYATLKFFDPAEADLTLAASATPTTPFFGNTVELTYQVTNNGPQDATGVTVDIDLPSGLSYNSQAGDGTYDDGVEVWTIPGTIPSGSSQTITITANVAYSGSYTTIAEIATSDQPDSSSTPGNGVTTEDDYQVISISPQTNPGPPTLNCPVSEQFSHVWSAPGTTNGWTASDTNKTFTAGGNNLSMTLSGDTNRFIPRNFGGTTIPTPVTNQQMTGGLPPGPYGVVMYVDYATVSESITIAIDLGDPGIGLGGLQFQMRDIDAGTWIDQITVNGTLGGVTQSHIMTPGVANTVSGNVVTGTSSSGNTSGNGNVTVTFLDSVDRVELIYANAATQPNPSAQVLSLQDFLMCQPTPSAALTAQKTVELFDPSTDTFMIPGSEILYRITITNPSTATSTASNIDVVDTLPNTVTFVTATTSGFSGGAFGSPPLPSNGDDCNGGACVVRFAGASLPPNATGEVQVRAIIK